jgi:hypothetical protein
MKVNMNAIANVDILMTHGKTRCLLTERKAVSNLYYFTKWDSVYARSHHTKHVNKRKGCSPLREVFC